jgi:hypothetical protein
MVALKFLVRPCCMPHRTSQLDINFFIFFNLHFMLQYKYENLCKM